MSTKQHSDQQQQSRDDLAREYIDDIMEINTEHGMVNSPSEDVYREAVDGAASAFRWIRA